MVAMGGDVSMDKLQIGKEMFSPTDVRSTLTHVSAMGGMGWAEGQ